LISKIPRHFPRRLAPPNLIKLSHSIPSKRRDPILIDQFPDIGISLSLHHAPQQPAPSAWMLRPHLNRHFPDTTQIRRQKARPNSPNHHPILFQLKTPIQHQHIQRHLATTVPDRLELDFLRPAGRLRRRREVVLCCDGDLGEAGYEYEAWRTGCGRGWGVRFGGEKEGDESVG